MTEVAFAGQLTEADYRRVNAVVARKVVLAWSGGLALIILVQLWQWGWRGVLANPTWAAIVFVPLILVMPSPSSYAASPGGATGAPTRLCRSPSEAGFRKGGSLGTWTVWP